MLTRLFLRLSDTACVGYVIEYVSEAEANRSSGGEAANIKYKIVAKIGVIYMDSSGTKTESHTHNQTAAQQHAGLIIQCVFLINRGPEINRSSWLGAPDSLSWSIEGNEEKCNLERKRSWPQPDKRQTTALTPANKCHWDTMRRLSLRWRCRRQQQITALPTGAQSRYGVAGAPRENQLHQHRRLPSIAYFMSRANRFHIISALILPTFNSCGNLVEWNGIPVRITSPSPPPPTPHCHHVLCRAARRPELQQTTDVQEDMLAESHYPIIPHLPSIIPKTGWITAERCGVGVRGGEVGKAEDEKNEWIQEEMAQLRGESAWRCQTICPIISYAYRFSVSPLERDADSLIIDVHRLWWEDSFRLPRLAMEKKPIYGSPRSQ